MINQDIINSFNKAVLVPVNKYQSGEMNWMFVEADIFIEFLGTYTQDYLVNCLTTLIEGFSEEVV